MRVRVCSVMKWHSLYQSVSHAVMAVVPEYLPPLKRASLHTATARPPHGKPSFCPLLSFSVPFCFTTSFYLNFTSCPFSVYYFLRSSPGSRSTGNEGGTLRGVEFFLSFLAPIANRHKALWPFLHAFHTLHLSLLLLSRYEKRRFSAGQFLFSGLLTSAGCLNKA